MDFSRPQWSLDSFSEHQASGLFRRAPQQDRHRQAEERQTLERQTLKRQTLERQTLERQTQQRLRQAVPPTELWRPAVRRSRQSSWYSRSLAVCHASGSRK